MNINRKYTQVVTSSKMNPNETTVYQRHQHLTSTIISPTTKRATVWLAIIEGATLIFKFHVSNLNSRAWQVH